MHFNLAFIVRVIFLYHLVTNIENMLQILLRYMNVKTNSMFTVAPGFRYEMLSFSFADYRLGITRTNRGH